MRYIINIFDFIIIPIFLCIFIMLLSQYVFCAEITVNHIRENATDKTVYFTISDDAAAISAARYHADIPLDADAADYLFGISDKLTKEIADNPDFQNTHDYSGTLADRALAVLEADQKAYIHGHYDLGTLLFFKSMRDNPETSADIKTMLSDVETWINSVLAYYYQKKEEIRQAAVPEKIVWDFKQFDATRPDVSLERLF